MLASDTPTRIKLKLMFAEDHDCLLECVNSAIDWACQELARSPKYKQKKSEDELTVELVSILRAIGLQASHDTDVGGHCDIVVEGRDEFLWLGEAKKHINDYSWLWKGFKQLDTRYSTGSKGQNAGGILIYCYVDRADRMMEKWKERLLSEMPNLKIEECPNNFLAFVSTHIHRRTGAPFLVRHVPVSLYFNPEDN